MRTSGWNEDLVYSWYKSYSNKNSTEDDTWNYGINIKRLHNIVFASPSKSRIRNLQSIGRGLRIGKDKENVVLYDIADDLSWKKNTNYTLNHFSERINTYSKESFNYEIHSVRIPKCHT